MVAINPSVDESGGRDIYDDIIKALKDNGELDDKTFRRLVLFALVDLGRGRRDSKICRESIAKVDTRVKRLEKQSVVGMAHKHPKAATTIGVIMALFVVAVISRLDLWIWIGSLVEGLLEVPLP